MGATGCQVPPLKRDVLQSVDVQLTAEPPHQLDHLTSTPFVRLLKKPAAKNNSTTMTLLIIGICVKEIAGVFS
jgi:hypothetical protein